MNSSRSMWKDLATLEEDTQRDYWMNADEAVAYIWSRR